MSTLVTNAKPLKHHSLCYQLRCQLYGNELDRFLTTKNGDKYQTKSIHLLDNISLDLSIYPNGCTNKHESYVQCLLIIPQLLSILSGPIHNITIHFQLFCYQTSTKFEDIKIFTPKSNGIGWPSKSLKLSKCKQYNQLDFICNLEILQIRYNKQYINKSYYKLLQTHKLVIVSWNINNLFFNQIKSETFGKLFYSKQIANYWRIAISPNYSYNTLMMNCNLSFYLILDLLPPYIKSITVLFKLECAEIGVKHSKISRFSYKQRMNAWPLVYLADNDDDELKFTFTIKILKIKSINDSLIPINKWVNYGINNELIFGDIQKQETDIMDLHTCVNNSYQITTNNVMNRDEKTIKILPKSEMGKYLGDLVDNVGIERDYSTNSESISLSSSPSTMPSWNSHVSSNGQDYGLELNRNKSVNEIQTNGIIQSDTINYENIYIIAKADDC
eukprot:87239_1